MPRNYHNLPKPLPELSSRDIQRFLGYVDKREPKECWPWTRYKKCTGGHGIIMINKKPVRASRVAYFLHYGVDPFPHLVCHDCPGGDNPACCNPAHLFLGSDADNMRDRMEKGRAPRGETHWRSTITSGNVLEMRKLHGAGGTTQDLAKRFGIATRTVRHIVNRTRWRHV